MNALPPSPLPEEGGDYRSLRSQAGGCAFLGRPGEGAMEILDQLRQQGVAPTRLTADSRQVRRGDVFVAFPGAHVDGRDFIAQALERGAAAVIAEAGAKSLLAAGGTPAVEVAGLAALSGEIAHLVYGRPSEKLWLAGITGTNGKTSVSQWIAQALEAMGKRCAVVGTLGNGFVDGLVESPNTTPDAITLHAALAGFLERGAQACAMEVSSIGLDQGRTNGVAFDVAIFTNLTRDHLEYHGTMQAYAAAKERLFAMPGLGATVINLDDPFGIDLARRLKGRLPTLGYTLENASADADEVLCAENLRMGAAGIEFELRGATIAAPVVGRFNVSNLLAVAGALLTRGESLDAIAKAMRSIRPPPGRMQVLGGHHQPLVVVDYAHTPDALEKALGVLRETATARGGKLVCVFGCGGDRDPGKRPQMGAIAEQLADCVLVTSDNPRSEDSQAIIAAIVSGMKARPPVQIDRAQAVAEAIAAADARDVVLLAGKGHEPYQEIAGVRHAYSDLDAAKSALEARR